MAGQLLSDEDLMAGAPAAPGAKPASSPRLYSDQELRAAPADMKFPAYNNVVDDPERGAGIGTTMRASLAPNTEDQIKRFASARGISPNLYGVVNGEIVYYHQPTGQLVREVPSVGAGNGIVDTVRRAGHYLASSVGPALPGAAGAAAGAAAGPTGMSIPVSAGAAAATDILRQLADRALAGEDPADIDYLNAAGQGAMAATGQAVGVGMAKATTRNPLGVAAAEKATAKDPANLAAWERLRQDAATEGVPLSVGELTGLRSLTTQERALRRFPETADAMTKFVEDRNTQAVPSALRRYIGPTKPSEVATGNMVDAAGDVIGKAVQDRTKAASQFYESAFNSGTQPDVLPVVQTIDDRLSQVARGTSTAKALDRVRNMLVTGAEEVVDPQTGQKVMQIKTEPDYRRLHSAKEEIDSMLEDIDALGGSADKRAKRALTEVQQQLTGILRGSSPEYEQGYQAFIAASPYVDELRKGGVGALSRMGGQQRSQLLDSIFSASRIAPGDVKAARDAFVAAGKSDEWNDGLSAWLTGKLESALSINANGQAGNVPGKIVKTLWGDENQREILRMAMTDPGRAQGIERLMGVLQAAARTLPEGSPTATDTAAMARMADTAGRGVKMLGALTSPETALKGGALLANAYNELRAPAARQKLAEALLSPDALTDLRKLALLSPGSEKALVSASNVLTMAGLGSGIRATGAGVPADKPVPAMPSADWQ